MSADSIEKIADEPLAEVYKQVTDSAPLMDRLKEARERIGKMCSERRGPRMSIPVQWYDDDVFICKTIEDAMAALPSAELERDAARYRWMRQFDDVGKTLGLNWKCNDGTRYADEYRDADIDDARAKDS